jgi:hypothetical protein
LTAQSTGNTVPTRGICRLKFLFARLSLFRKAKLGNTFRWQLQELGYTEGFAENVTKGLVVRLARKK